MKALILGDLHFKANNILEVRKLIASVSHHVEQQHFDFIVLLGDIMNDHERLHVLPYMEACRLIDLLSDVAPVFLLVGNHDYINNQQFLTENHWMNPLKKWNNVVVVDHPVGIIHGNQKVTLVPYVPNGRFLEALGSPTEVLMVDNGTVASSLQRDWNWGSSNVIFAHQEFVGCKMGPMISTEGDYWEVTNPQVISGHIHLRQRPQDNIYYPGSSMQVSFVDSTPPELTCVIIDEGKTRWSHVSLGLERKRTYYLTIDQARQFQIGTRSPKLTKLSLNGSIEDFRVFKKSREFKSITKLGVKVSFRPEITKRRTEDPDRKEDFLDILKKLIEKEKSPELDRTFREIVLGTM